MRLNSGGLSLIFSLPRVCVCVRACVRACVLCVCVYVYVCAYVLFVCVQALIFCLASSLHGVFREVKKKKSGFFAHQPLS
jgi:hypothetical protein